MGRVAFLKGQSDIGVCFVCLFVSFYGGPVEILQGF